MNIIVVVDEKWNIGKDGTLLVHLPGDLKYFREKTLGKTVVVGRKTLESFPGGRPLPGRENIVLTRNMACDYHGCHIYHSKQELLEALEGKDVFIAGGAEVYRQFLEDCDTFFVTKIYETFEADRSFPNLDEMNGIQVTWQSDMQEEKGIRYQFFEYKRK